MTLEESITIQANRAHENYEAIVQCKYNIAAHFLKLGQLFKDNRDQSMYKLLGHDSFEDFLGDISFSRAKVYGLIHVYELYVEKLRVPERDILDVGNTKLLMIAPVVESDPEEWIGKAKALSKSDLRLEISGRAAGGKPPGYPKKNLSPPLPSPPVPPTKCCICGDKEWEKHHFPLTRGAGGLEHWWIPTCRKCHSEYHQDPVKWTATYKRQWAKYLYDERRADDERT